MQHKHVVKTPWQIYVRDSYKMWQTYKIPTNFSLYTISGQPRWPVFQPRGRGFDSRPRIASPRRGINNHCQIYFQQDCLGGQLVRSLCFRLFSVGLPQEQSGYA
uniref:Uncharacterized protein n=1 Tax=Cacopsylla melanoneura TaxID=428564 RepID=A0A8D8Y0R8_9HEMI